MIAWYSRARFSLSRPMSCLRETSSCIGAFLRMASVSLALLVMLLLVVLHDRARGHLLGAAAVAARLLGRLLDVLVLALLLGADALEVLPRRLLWHGMGLRVRSSGPSHSCGGSSRARPRRPHRGGLRSGACGPDRGEVGHAHSAQCAGPILERDVRDGAGQEAGAQAAEGEAGQAPAA